MVDPFAARGSFLPVLRRFKVFRPPGEGAALFGTQIIDCALLSFQKDAVIVAGMFAQGNPISDTVSVFADEFFLGNFEVFGKGFDFGGRDPNISGGASAALAATGAFKS